MGTRNLLCVVQNGEMKVANYCQWDGRPTHQGEGIRQFLVREYAEDKLKRFGSQIKKVKAATKAMIDKAIKTSEGMGDDFFSRRYPQFSRDTGHKILDYFMETDKPQTCLSADFAGDSLFCEWAYVIDLDNGMLEIYKGFNRSPVPESNRFHKFTAPGEYHPVRLVKTVEISKLAGQRSLMASIEKSGGAE